MNANLLITEKAKKKMGHLYLASLVLIISSTTAGALYQSYLQKKIKRMEQTITQLQTQSAALRPITPTYLKEKNRIEKLHHIKRQISQEKQMRGTLTILEKYLPATVKLNKINLTYNKTIASGSALTTHGIANFITQLNANKTSLQATLTHIGTHSDNNTIQFSFNLSPRTTKK